MREENYDVAKLRNIRTIFEPEKYYYKPIKIVKAFDDNYIE